MASIPATLVFPSLISFFIRPILSSSIIEDLNQPPPPDFQAIIIKNCVKNPSLRYCGAASSDVSNIFKSTIVASHLCNESKNPNCPDSFTKIDLQARPIIAPLYLSFTFFWKYCPLSILTIDLSNNSLKGAFPSDVLFCTQIQLLDLSHNELIGTVPTENFSTLSNLTFLNLSYNRFSESNLSETQFFKRFNSSSFIRSGLLTDDHKFNVGSMVLLISFVILPLLMVGFSGWLCFRRPHNFTLPMIKAATDEFSEENLVGRSGTIEMYSGVLTNGTAVLIEIYREKISSDLHREFVGGCRILAQLDHKNLVPVLGWCDYTDSRAIVMKRIDGDSVEKWLLGGPPWKHRLKVLRGVVEAMCYLQDQWPQVGYDLRTRSILVADDCKPLISRFKVQDQNNISKRIYKFGVFLLELVTNRHAGEEIDGSEAGFIQWIRQHYPHYVPLLIDNRMKMTSATLDQAMQAISIGLMCVDPSSNRQRGIGQIYSMINRLPVSSLDTALPTHLRPHNKRSKVHKRMHSR